MTNAVNSISNHTVAGKLQEAQKEQKPKRNPVTKGATIGAAIGAGASGAFYGSWINNVYKDEFQKISSEAIKKAAKNGSIEGAFKDSCKIMEESAKKALKATKEGFSSLGVTKGMFLKSIGAAGLALGVVGAGIGLIVKHHNNKKQMQADIADLKSQLNKTV